MANTCVSLQIHVVFSTKDRAPVIATEWRERLWAYLGGIGRENNMKALEIGGVADHVHLLVSIPATLATSRRFNCSKGIHPNGSMKLSNCLAASNGRKVTAHSV